MDFFTDNFYTRHKLAKELKLLTDDKAQMIGTMKFTNIDSTNQIHLKEAIEQLKYSERGSWKLLQVYEPPIQLTEERKNYTCPCSHI